MDPNQPKTPDQNLPVPDASTNNSYMDNVNKPQTPAFNDTDYWNTKPENPAQNASSMAEPANPPEPLDSSEPQVSSTSTEASSPDLQPPTPATSEADQPTQEPEPAEPENQKWDNPAPTSTPPSEPKSNTMTIIMIVIVVILLGATALFAFQNYQLKKQPVATPTAQATPATEATPAATADPYADWKVYKDPDNRFSFKYPQDFQVVEASTSAQPKNLYVKTDSRNFEAYITANPDGFDKSSQADGTVNKVKIFRFSKKGTYDSEYAVIPLTTGVAVIKGVFYQVQGVPTVDDLQIFTQITYTLTVADSTNPSPVAAGTCEKGYKAYSGDGYSLCYPETLVKGASTTSGQVVFENANETLKVTQNFQGGWGGSACLFIDKTTVAGYASKRLSWKTEQTGGGCDNTFVSFAEMINEGNFKFPFPYALELTSKKTPFQDNVEFLTIEKSFQVVSPSPSPNGS